MILLNLFFHTLNCAAPGGKRQSWDVEALRQFIAYLSTIKNFAITSYDYFECHGQAMQNIS